MLCGELDQAFEPRFEFGREVGGRGDGARLVDEAQHDADVVSLAGVQEVEEIAVGELRISLPGAVGDEDADLVKIELLGVGEIALHLGSVVLEPEAGMAARADGGVERGGVIEAADAG